MQLHITLRGGETTLPIAYRHIQQAMIYQAVRTQDSEQAEHLHNTGHQAENRRFKLFTFGPLLGNYTVNGGVITFRGEIRFEVRSADPYLLRTLLIAWKPGTIVRLGRNELAVVDCWLENNVITERHIRVKTIAPIVSYITCEDGRTVFYSPEEDEFCSMLRTNTERKWLSFTGESDVPEFRCVPMLDRPIRKQVTKFKDTRINAWHGSFELSGDVRILNLLYHTGLGAKSSQGFGMFDLCKE